MNTAVVHDETPTSLELNLGVVTYIDKAPVSRRDGVREAKRSEWKLVKSKLRQIFCP